LLAAGFGSTAGKENFACTQGLEHALDIQRDQEFFLNNEDSGAMEHA
jgi:hypothetical protein